MKTLSKPILLVLMLLWLSSCQSNQDGKYHELNLMQATDSTAMQPAPSTSGVADQETPVLGAPGETKLPARQFIRTASVKFRVANVALVTDQIETLTAQQGGFVTFTKLDSQLDDRQTVAISADSLLETTRYTVSNTVTLRVPNARLDTTLRALVGLADYLDYREIKADDVALQRLAAALTQQRNRAYNQRLRVAISQRDQKLGDVNNTEENRLNHQQQTDEAQLNDLALVDQLQFSTVTLTIYQRQSIQRTVLPNVDTVKVYEPGFLTRASDALSAGSQLLTNFILLLLEGWGIILFCLTAYVLTRYVIRRFKRPLAIDR